MSGRVLATMALVVYVMGLAQAIWGPPRWSPPEIAKDCPDPMVEIWSRADYGRIEKNGELLLLVDGEMCVHPDFQLLDMISEAGKKPYEGFHISNWGMKAGFFPVAALHQESAPTD